jgi:hypothetical protein
MKYQWVRLLQNNEGPVAKRLRWVAYRPPEWYLIEQQLIAGRFKLDQVYIKGN